MPSPKPDIRALECGHPNIRQSFTAARHRRDIRQAIEALPPNLFHAIIAAMRDQTPHADAVRNAINRRYAREHAAHCKRYPDD